MFVLFLVCVINSLSAKTIRWVKVDGTGDGTSWANASNSIQTMIDNSTSGDEVWVAKGTYYPTYELVARDARSRTFLLKDGVNLYGGFSGNETATTQRKLSDLNGDGKIDSFEFSNVTLLSGDIDGIADVWSKNANLWTITGNTGNCYRVVYCQTAFVIESLFDGFTIAGGNFYKGSGIYNQGKNIVQNCIIQNNVSVNISDGALFNMGNVNNCLIQNNFSNKTGSGGGVYNTGVINNCTIINNSAGGTFISQSAGGAGGIQNNGSVNNCLITNNSAVYSVTNSGGGGYASSLAGGGIVNEGLIDNCVISNNYSSVNVTANGNYTSSGQATGYSGGGVKNSGTITNCFVNNNTAHSTTSLKNTGGSGNYEYSESGGGVHNSGTVSNCIVINNISTCRNGQYSGNGGILNKGNVYCSTVVNQTVNILETINFSKVGNSLNCITDNTNLVLNFNNPLNTINPQKNDWYLKKGSTYINSGSTSKVNSGQTYNLPVEILNGTDIDGRKRVSLGKIDLGANEYIMPTVTPPILEDFNICADFYESLILYGSGKINGLNTTKWIIDNKKAVFDYKTNLTNYSESFSTYIIDATSKNKINLVYDMNFITYGGSAALTVEQLSVEYSTDYINWNVIANYTNANGNITNKTYVHDISSNVAGKLFWIRFRAFGVNSNNIEKWELDNVVIDGVTAIEDTKEDKLFYSINESKLIFKKIDEGSSIKLFDINGKLLISKIATNINSFLVLPQRGVYIVKVESDHKSKREKIVW